MLLQRAAVTHRDRSASDTVTPDAFPHLREASKQVLEDRLRSALEFRQVKAGRAGLHWGIIALPSRRCRVGAIVGAVYDRVYFDDSGKNARSQTAPTKGDSEFRVGADHEVRNCPGALDLSEETGGLLGSAMALQKAGVFFQNLSHLGVFAQVVVVARNFRGFGKSFIRV